MTKKCSSTDCAQTNPQPIDNFYNDKRNKKDGKYPICKACKATRVYKWRDENRDQYNASAKQWGQRNTEKRYGSEIKRRYGCTLEMYNTLLVRQEGKCAICSVLHNPAEKKGRLYVDHCHATGKIRALLCKHCNSMLGYAKDDTRIMLEAVAYIVRHKAP